MTAGDNASLGERADVVLALGTSRQFLRHTARGLTDEQAGQRTTVSELCIGGLIKHVYSVEQNWVRFILEGPPERKQGGDGPDTWADRFRMLPGETLEGLLKEYEETAHRTDELATTLPDLDLSHPLPEAPWFEKGARWSVRQVLLHILAETAQHAGHADIIREALDGAKSMG